MARRWHIAAHNRPNGHQEHGRNAHVVLRHMEEPARFLTLILTCVRLAKSHSEITQIVRAGFAVARVRVDEDIRGMGDLRCSCYYLLLSIAIAISHVHVH